MAKQLQQRHRDSLKDNEIVTLSIQSKQITNHTTLIGNLLNYINHQVFLIKFD